MELHKVKIVKVYITDKKKSGEEYKTKDGKKFWRVGIKTDKFGETWYSTNAFKADAPEMAINEGDEIEISTDTSNGYNNFKIPGRLDILEARVAAIEARLGSGPDAGPEPSTETTPKIDDDDLPF